MVRRLADPFQELLARINPIRFALLLTWCAEHGLDLLATCGDRTWRCTFGGCTEIGRFKSSTGAAELQGRDSRDGDRPSESGRSAV
jgi:hypothetical protein